MDRDYLIEKINMTIYDFSKVIKHCKRKLEKKYYDDETKEQQAFGVIIGNRNNKEVYITKVVPLKNNYRFNDNVSDKMNELIKQYAIPGGIDIEERAWVADPEELSIILSTMEDNEEFIGTYHMHHDMSWKGEYPRQLPTELDRVLSEKSNLYSFIVYIDIKNNNNTIRAFYEAKAENEIDIIVSNNR